MVVVTVICAPGISAPVWSRMWPRSRPVVAEAGAGVVWAEAGAAGVDKAGADCEAGAGVAGAVCGAGAGAVCVSGAGVVCGAEAGGVCGAGAGAVCALAAAVARARAAEIRNAIKQYDFEYTIPSLRYE